MTEITRITDAGCIIFPFEIPHPRSSSSREALAFLNSILAKGYPSLEVISGKEVVPVYRTCETQQGSILLPIALSAFHLLTQAEKHRRHKCKNDRCILFFYDMTKSATRHWCSLECMNRARSIQHYKQAKEKQWRPSLQ